MTTRPSPRNIAALIAVCLSALMLGLEITSIPSILPTLEHDLPATFQQLQWIMNAYTIAMCAMLMAMGALGDRFGRKRIFGGGILVFAVASLLCGLANSAPLLIAARFLQGTSAAAMLACQLAVLSHQFRDGADRGKAFGWWGIVFGSGLGFGPIIGGVILTLSNWHWVFLIHVPIALITLAFTRTGVEDSSNPRATRVDLGGMATLSLTVFGLVYLITQGRSLGMTSPTALAILCASLLCLALFLVIETRTVQPMFDLRAFRIRTFSGGLLGSMGMNFSFWPFIIYLPIYLQAVLGHDAVTRGLIVLAYTLPTIIVPPFAERLLARRGPAVVLPLGLLTIGAGFLLLGAAIGSPWASWMTLLPGCVLSGIGLGLTNTPVSNTVTGALPPERAGIASGMDMSTRMTSLALNIALMGFILHGGITSALGRAASGAVSGMAPHDLADLIAAGNLARAESLGLPLSLARDALAQGVGTVTLYGALCACGLALLCAVVLRRRGAARPTVSPSAAE